MYGIPLALLLVILQAALLVIIFCMLSFQYIDWLHGTFHSPPLPSFEEVTAVAADFQQPLVLLWNPKITHYKVVQDRLNACVRCGLPYDIVYWNDGSSDNQESSMQWIILCC